AGNEKLIATGFYRYVRHPIYTFTLLAFLVAPLMTLDRMLVVISVSLYLAVAIPVEERKLIAIFGKDYEAYRKRVPAVIPKLT
ncbi:MAG: methyltransferase family protein, partial [Bdellovibrionota bacterium]